MGLQYSHRSKLVLLVRLLTVSRKHSSYAFLSEITQGRIDSNITSNRDVNRLNQLPFCTSQRRIALGSRANTMITTSELYSTAEKDTEINHEESEPSDSNDTTHYVFLVHGWLGNDLEMKYIGTALEASKAKHEIHSLNSNKNRLVVHRTKDNNGKTTDGIIKGGTRLAKEIENFILNDTAEQLDRDDVSNIRERHVSISFVGNSLGGLYARYAISLLPAELDEEKIVPDTRILIHSNVFCTTATPHLGCASNTYITIPRFCEKGIAWSFDQTGKDLFRSDKRKGETDLIHDMCTNYDQFLLPLSKFQKRIAYANAFGTDFQVPTNTAAFLSEGSMYTHRPADPMLLGKDDNEMKEDEKNSFIVAVLTTEQNSDILKGNKGEEDDYLPTMSNNMDALGWTKVFIDVREKIPGPRLPRLRLPFTKTSNRRQKWNDFLQEKVSKSKTYESTPVFSRDLARLMNGSETVGLPIGHQVMVANSKSKTYSSMTANGQPVMDKLANDLLHAILETEGKKR